MAAAQVDSAKAMTRKFICPHCNASFRRSGHLSRHKRSHTNEKPFRCPHCESAFGRFDILLRHERTIHGSTDSTQMYSKGTKGDGVKGTKRIIPHDLTFPSSSSTTLLTKTTAAPTLTPTQTFTDHYQFSSHTTNGLTSGPSTASSTFGPSPPAADTTSILDPQLLSLQPSPQHMLPIPTPPSLAIKPASHSPDSLPGPSPFPYHDFTFFDELNYSLGILNPTDDFQSQIDQLMNSVVPSGAATGAYPSTPKPDVDASLFRIPASNEVPIKGNHSAPPPTKVTVRKLNEEAWEHLQRQVKSAEAEMTDLEEFTLPKVSAINRYTSAYISGLHQHIPFLHLPTLNLNEVEIPRLLAMCSLGALYCFEKEVAMKLHSASMIFLGHELEGKHEKGIRDSIWVCQTMLMGMLFAAWNGEPSLFRRSLTLHSVLANNLRSRLRFLMTYSPPSSADLPWSTWIYQEEFRRTYYVSFCFLIQLQMLYDIPTSLPISEISLPLPSSEEEWSAETSSEWSTLHTSTPPPTPLFKPAFELLFLETSPTAQTLRYSEFGGYIMISALNSVIMNAYRVASTPAIDVNWHKFDVALDNWQRSWNADPKSHSTGPSSPFGAMAFNASAIYRAASIRRVRDYSKVKATVQFMDDKISSEEMLRTLNDPTFHRCPKLIRALVPACVSLQIPVKMGVKLVAQTAALFWSVEHVFCNFEVALFLSQWLCSIEREGTANLSNEEAKIVSLLRDLLFEAETEADPKLPLSCLLLTVWADQFDGVNVWGITTRLAKIFRAVAEAIKADAIAKGIVDVPMRDESKDFNLKNLD